MIDDAQRLGADAIVNVRFTTSMIVQGASELLAYGTELKPFSFLLISRVEAIQRTFKTLR
jgi:hypothetical protein